MRVEPFGVGSFVHVMKRGARGMPIVKNEEDRLRFARLLYFLNDTHGDEYWERNTKELDIFERPDAWPDRNPLVRIHAWVLMPNHFHLILEEIREGGVAKFMQKLCGSMSAYHNAKYHERGSLFQGGYKSRTVSSDRHLRQLVPYVAVKNVFELFPGGYAKALGNFESAWTWGTDKYVFSSLPEHMGERSWPITERGIIDHMFLTPASFKKHAKEVLFSRQGVPEELKRLAFE